jgi:hypothetical protein
MCHGLLQWYPITFCIEFDFLFKYKNCEILSVLVKNVLFVMNKILVMKVKECPFNLFYFRLRKKN